MLGVLQLTQLVQSPSVVGTHTHNSHLPCHRCPRMLQWKAAHTHTFSYPVGFRKSKVVLAVTALIVREGQLEKGGRGGFLVRDFSSPTGLQVFLLASICFFFGGGDLPRAPFFPAYLPCTIFPSPPITFLIVSDAKVKYVTTNNLLLN